MSYTVANAPNAAALIFDALPEVNWGLESLADLFLQSIRESSGRACRE